ncbi:hypothetical protein C8J56DRAFT_880915 [Mycena floridula]|nr:hypothetical protein C8J56DRAFT_880915 [Mycena floridula]
MPARNNKRENWDNSRNNEWEPDKDDGSCDKLGAVQVIQHISKHPNADRQAFGVTRTVDFSKIHLRTFTATCWNADHDQSWETRQAYPFDKVINVGSAEGDVSRHLVHVRNQMLSQRGLTKADFEHGETPGANQLQSAGSQSAVNLQSTRT